MRAAVFLLVWHPRSCINEYQMSVTADLAGPTRHNPQAACLVKPAANLLSTPDQDKYLQVGHCSKFVVVFVLHRSLCSLDLVGSSLRL